MQVMISRSPRTCGLILLLLPALSGQVVFSRRVYKESGPSYQQLWNWNPSDNSLTQLTDSPRNHFRPSCSGQHLLFVSPKEWPANAELWSFDRTTRDEKLVGLVPPEADRKPAGIKGCDVSAESGPVQACAKHSELSISLGGKQTGSLRVSNDYCPIQFLAWSPSGKWLLVGALGTDTNSTSPQSDLFVLDPVAMKLTKAASGNAAAWLPDRDELFYTSPRDMASLGGARRPRSVWVEHLMVFNPASGKTTAITNGVTNNLQPSVCRK
jgi:hypothetical protein